jgi:hypothetical protein
VRTRLQRHARRLTLAAIVWSAVCLITDYVLFFLDADVSGNQPILDVTAFALSWGYVVVTPLLAGAAIACDRRATRQVGLNGIILVLWLILVATIVLAPLGTHRRSPRASPRAFGGLRSYELAAGKAVVFTGEGRLESCECGDVSSPRTVLRSAAQCMDDARWA